MEAGEEAQIKCCFELRHGYEKESQRPDTGQKFVTKTYWASAAGQRCCREFAREQRAEGCNSSSIQPRGSEVAFVVSRRNWGYPCRFAMLQLFTSITVRLLAATMFHARARRYLHGADETLSANCLEILRVTFLYIVRFAALMDGVWWFGISPQHHHSPGYVCQSKCDVNLERSHYFIQLSMFTAAIGRVKFRMHVSTKDI
ncbi:hypothetical protein B0T17DRAFT_269482 [Bombardia bombarda]|uniref:Uncharacterized protein n=1 Tax=Bombardia bombarda TaxID=252184 RepID=A0AA39X192_9PEZI|nr:hypothetical protein B0T17DRAFT_269482 [Bombardia bombarda]